MKNEQNNKEENQKYTVKQALWDGLKVGLATGTATLAGVGAFIGGLILLVKIVSFFCPGTSVEDHTMMECYEMWRKYFKLEDSEKLKEMFVVVYEGTFDDLVGVEYD